MAVPGPFKRIARAGGQKVTIRIAQRPLPEMGSGRPKHFLIKCVTIADGLLVGRKHWQINAIAAKLALQRRA